jgi:hypothetical protein
MLVVMVGGDGLGCSKDSGGQAMQAFALLQPCWADLLRLVTIQRQSN